MSFLLDTDTCSAHLKQKGNLTHKFVQYMGRLHVSVITLGELFTWALRKAPPRRLQPLLDLLNDVQVLDVTDPIARQVWRSAGGASRCRAASTRAGLADRIHGGRSQPHGCDSQYSRLRQYSRPEPGGLVGAVA